MLEARELKLKPSPNQFTVITGHCFFAGAGALPFVGCGGWLAGRSPNANGGAVAGPEGEAVGSGASPDVG